VSYRSFKHLLGETSLERKCRFIFGLGILVLVAGSFFIYGQKTEGIVLLQTTQTARMLVNPTLKDLHFRALGNSDFEDVLEVLSEDFKSIGDLPPHKAYVLYPYNTKETKKRATDANEIAALARFLKSAVPTDGILANGMKSRESTHTFPDGSKTWAQDYINGKLEFQYIQAVVFKPSCLMDCHATGGRSCGRGGD
jgi:two-component system, NarL family, sensor histidine kinase BarA